MKRFGLSLVLGLASLVGAASASAADLPAYLQTDQKLVACYADAKTWTRKAILNVASSGKFSSDRTISEYAADIWNVEPCPIE